ncbi:transposase [Pseudomonas sp. CCC2.2]|uniref:IS66 family transposase n=1 Tax=Pseudomonas sp. CCC2.2 TaxID=3048605 RepID=UPI0034DD4F12
MRNRLLESPVIHRDETRVEVLKEPDQDLTSQSRMWLQASGPQIEKSCYSTTPPAVRRCAVALAGQLSRLCDDDDYAGYNTWGAQPGVTRLACLTHVRRSLKSATQRQNCPYQYSHHDDKQAVRYRARDERRER